MGKFRDYLNEARAMSVPTEYRIALGQLKRMYNPGEVPSEKELQKDVEMIAKKNHLEADKFLEFVKTQFKMNESNIDEAKPMFKAGDQVQIVKTGERGKITSLEHDRAKINDKFWFYLKDIKLIKLNESAVGKPGRTTEKDAEEHINDELVAEFKKIIKKLGGKTVAKVLLDKLSTKPEIKDEIEHIEDIIDNSNY